MAGTSKLEFEAETQTHADKFYNMIKYSLHHLPTVFPASYKSCEILEGDGENVGTVRLWKYVLPGTTELLSGKETLIEKDDEKRFMKVSIVEGDLVDHYSTFLISIHVNPKGDGSVVKWTLEFEKANNDVPDPHHYMDLFMKINEHLDAHLIKT